MEDRISVSHVKKPLQRPSQSCSVERKDGDRIFYEVNQAAQANRYFSKEVRYSHIDWSNLNKVVDAFRLRIQDWYLDPAKQLATNGHFAFSVMALNCLLIDTLSQFVYGTDSSKHCKFKEFIRERLPSAYSCRLKLPIQHPDGKREELTDIADSLYHGFRCGILHQAHIAPYGGIDPDASQPAWVEDSGFVKYKEDGADCPTVIVNPRTLLIDLSEAFQTYLQELKDRNQELKDRNQKNDQLRANFKRKFSSSFGVDISLAT